MSKHDAINAQIIGMMPSVVADCMKWAEGVRPPIPGWIENAAKRTANPRVCSDEYRYEQLQAYKAGVENGYRECVSALKLHGLIKES